MSIRAVIFDIGGVLEITPPTRWQQRWAAALGLEAAEIVGRLQPIWSLGATGAISLGQVEQRIAEGLSLDEPKLAALMSDVWDEYLGTLNADLAAYFSGLRPRYRTGILSNSFVGAREREEATYGFEDMCDAVVYSHEEGCLKPDPRSYRAVCQRLGVTPAEAVFLDDTEACVEGARRVGMTAVRFLDNQQAIAEMNVHLGE